MAKNKIGLQFKGWKQMLSGIEKVSGEKGLKDATESALKVSKDLINGKVSTIMSKGNMPASGKYWTGDTKHSLDNNFDVSWSGYTAGIDIGFNFEQSGVTSIFLMYGTPRTKPVDGLFDAFYGKKTVSEIRKTQKKAIQDYIERNL